MVGYQLTRNVADADVAQIDNGTHGPYRLYAFSSTSGVRAVCYAFNEQGEEVLLFDHVVDTAAANHEFDSVRCVAVSDVYFTIFYLDYDTSAGTYELKSAYMDVSDFNATQTWTALSTITPDDAGLYDVQQVHNPPGDAEYILTWATSTTQCIVRRCPAVDHTASPTWSTTVTTNHADRILGCYADGGVGDDVGGVAIAYQDGTNQLEVYTLDYNDGTARASVTAYTTINAEFAAVGMCYSAANQMAVVAEFENADLPGTFTEEEERSHHIVCVEVAIDETPSATGKPHVTPNLNMLAKPYSYTDAESDMHVYCALGYKTVRPDAAWAQNVAYVCDMGLQHWSDTESTVRPRPVLNLNRSTVDSIHHGMNPEDSGELDADGVGRRMNHLSNWVRGPDLNCAVRKSRTVALPFWSALGIRSESNGGNADSPVTHPVGAVIKGVTHVLEEPWTYQRANFELGALSDNFHGSSPYSMHPSAPSQGELIVAGGSPHIYDGNQYVELGFPWVPEVIDVSDNGAGTNPSAGDYKYLAVFEWHDARGVLHRSGHGEPFEFTNTTGQAHDITVRCMNIGSKDAAWLYPNAHDMLIVLYRNRPANPNKFYRVFATDIATYEPDDNMVNNPAVWAMTITDEVPNNVLGSAPTLSYASGDPAASELPPVCPPACHAVANWKNRVWLAASENKRELWYSKENLPTAQDGTIAPEFHPNLVFGLDTVAGTVTALVPLDDALIIFTDRGIYALTGTGPDTLGQGAAWSLQVLHELTGCIEPRSVASVPAGIVFQSYKGMYLLNKGYELDFISTGAAVEELVRTSGNVRSGENLDDRHLVAFVSNGSVTGDPIVIKWDYYHRLWSTADLQSPSATAGLSVGASGCAWAANERDLSHVALSLGGLQVERGKDDANPYRDENNSGSARAVVCDIETGWISLAGIMGYKRLYEIGVQTGGGSDDLRCELDVDQDGSFTLGSEEDHIATIASTVPGHLRVRPAKQKMTSFRLRLYEDASSAEGDLVVYGITVRVGTKRGLRRVADTQIGTATGS